MNSQSSPPPDVVDSVALVRSGAATPRELVHDAIDRIEVGDGRLNAVVATRFEAALQEADAVDSDLPLAGVPILLKDVGLKGEPFYLGSRRYADLDWRFSATDLFTARLQRAGAVVVGYTNVPEYLSAATTESEVYGPCRNPWDITRTAGGSSGGAGAAVAAMFVPAAQSSDGGGSSRIPASANASSPSSLAAGAPRSRRPGRPGWTSPARRASRPARCVTSPCCWTSWLALIRSRPSARRPRRGPMSRRWACRRASCASAFPAAAGAARVLAIGRR